MFTKEQKKKIRNINLFEVFYGEKNGKPYYNKKEVFIPDVWQLKEDAISRIIQSGVEKVDMVEPKEANCIIRIFTKRHYECQYCGITNLYGYSCFVKENGKWISEAVNIFEISFSKYIVGYWLYPDEYVKYDCDYVDCYVRIS